MVSPKDFLEAYQADIETWTRRYCRLKGIPLSSLDDILANVHVEILDDAEPGAPTPLGYVQRVTNRVVARAARAQTRQRSLVELEEAILPPDVAEGFQSCLWDAVLKIVKAMPDRDRERFVGIYCSRLREAGKVSDEEIALLGEVTETFPDRFILLTSTTKSADNRYVERKVQELRETVESVLGTALVGVLLAVVVFLAATSPSFQSAMRRSGPTRQDFVHHEIGRANKPSRQLARVKTQEPIRGFVHHEIGRQKNRLAPRLGTVTPMDGRLLT